MQKVKLARSVTFLVDTLRIRRHHLPIRMHLFRRTIMPTQVLRQESNMRIKFTLLAVGLLGLASISRADSLGLQLHDVELAQQ
jgi:hypothetical protein